MQFLRPYGFQSNIKSTNFGKNHKKSYENRKFFPSRRKVAYLPLKVLRESSQYPASTNCIFFAFSTYRPLGGRSKWLILLEILDFLDFFSFRPLDERSKWSILLNILYFFNFLTSCWEVKLIAFTGYVDFSTFRPLAGRSKWLILLNIFDFFLLFDFSSCWWNGERSKWSILLNILDFFAFWPLGGGSK